MHLLRTLLFVARIAVHISRAVAGSVGEALLPLTSYLFSKEGCPVADGYCPNSNISYWFYTRAIQNNPYRIDPFDPDTIKYVPFIEGVPLKVIIHGYTGNRDYSPNMELRPAYFKRGEYNILTVDWGRLAPQPCYWEAAHNVDSVGKCIAMLLDQLFEAHRSVLSLDRTHVIGFSLGAHVAGSLCSSLRTGRVYRLTGLDPALPLFDSTTNSATAFIDPSDAGFADVYHSNMGHKGKKAASGHIDIYMNNGANQPGCNCNRSCDHVRAVEYFAESINSLTGFWSFPCWSWTFYMNGFCKVTTIDELLRVGEDISNKEHGVYMAFTNSKPEYLLDRRVYIDNYYNLSDKVNVDCPITNF